VDDVRAQDVVFDIVIAALVFAVPQHRHRARLRARLRRRQTEALRLLGGADPQRLQGQRGQWRGGGRRRSVPARNQRERRERRRKRRWFKGQRSPGHHERERCCGEHWGKLSHPRVAEVALRKCCSEELHKLILLGSLFIYGCKLSKHFRLSLFKRKIPLNYFNTGNGTSELIKIWILF